jgi:hypothetical protein
MGLSIEVDQMLKDGMPDTVTYTAYGESPASIPAIWTGEQARGGDYDDGTQEAAHGRIVCSSADVSSPDYRDTFAIGGETWRIPQGEDRWFVRAGLITIELVKFDREEVSGPEYRIRR